MSSGGQSGSGFAGYRQVLSLPGAGAFTAVGLIARLPISIIGLGIVLLVTSREASYALAGSLAAAFALAAALIAPFGARFADRLGQARVIPVLAFCQAFALVALVFGIDRSWPLPILFLITIVAGGVGPNVGSLVRARWIALLRGDPRLRSAFAWESVLDEVVFVTGPPLATLLALNLAPAAPLLLCAGLIALGVSALAALRSTDPGPSPALHGAPAGHALRLRGMPRITMIMVLLGGVFGAFEVTTVAYAQFAGRPEATGFLLAIYAFGSLLGGLLIGALRPRNSLTSQLTIATAILAVVSAPLFIVPNIFWLALLALAAGFAVAPVLIISVSLTEVLVPGRRITEALTVTVSGIAVGLAVAAPLSGLIIDSVGAQSAYLVMAASGGGTFLVAVLARNGLARWEQDSLTASRAEDLTAASPTAESTR